MNRGYPAAIATYAFWGLSPIYWKIVASVPALELLGTRICWAMPFLFAVLLYRRDFSVYKTVWLAPKKYLIYVLSAFLLATNWLVWIWSVTNGFVVDASLGYFINPLVNVVMGVLLLHEHLRRVQWISLIFAFVGVLYLTLNYGQFPWIALTLAGTFGLYGYIRKTAALGAINGLAVEVTLLLLPALILLLYLAHSGVMVMGEQPPVMHFWVSLSGFITIFPLALFAYGARRIPYSTIGFIQYIAPTGQFLLGIFAFHEDFNLDRLIGFSFIWLALLIYSLENLYFHKLRKSK
jgi:chloramphenicol-sensitive protein RarD